MLPRPVKHITSRDAIDRRTFLQEERMRTALVVPLGLGEIDYRPIFASAALAGMKHFYVEQDTAPQSGDSLAAAATSYRYLATLFA